MLRLIGTPIAARPVVSGAVVAVAVLFATVCGNAFYAQPGRHPKPFMATRPSALDTADAAASAGNETGLMAVPLVLEVQTALASSGHYAAALDGKPGKATAAAIRAFQSEHALRVDGEPSPALLAQIRQAMASPPSDAAQVASLDARMRESVGPGSADGVAPDGATGSVGTLPEKELVRRIQSGLANAEVAKLKADGIMGEQTRAAIRTFEALEGLDVTGAADPRILSRLIEIGAVE